MNSPLFTRTILDTKQAKVRSLVWHRDTLVDWVDGGATWDLDGKYTRSTVRYSYRFDAACASPNGRTVVLYERLGTKGLVLHDGRILREINRSFYHAHAYEYPVALFNAPDGRLLLAHCPDSYCRLDFEDALSGERLTAHPERKPDDFFHSRLQANPSGTQLLSAGWAWHPLDILSVYDVAAALADPRLLDRSGSPSELFDPDHGVEQSTAAWQIDTRLLISGGDEYDDPSPDYGLRLRPKGVALYDLERRECVSTASIGQPAGTLMAVGERHAVAFWKFPKLFKIATGRIVHAWDDLATGDEQRSILQGVKNLSPPLALDPARARFAVADAEKITVVSLDLAALR